MSADPTEPRPEPADPRPMGEAVAGRPEAIGRRPRRRLTWPLRGLLAASLAVPALLLALAAWQNYRLVHREATLRVINEAGELGEHDLSAFKIYPMVLDWVDQRIRGEGWSQLEDDAQLHRLLENLETLPQVKAIWIVDPAGRIRGGGRLFRAPSGTGVAAASMAGDDAFAAQRQGDAGLFVGREHVDALTGGPVFDLSRRIAAPDGGFGGAVILSASPRYFADFYARVSSGKDVVASLLRTDGAVLAGFPDHPAPSSFDPGGGLMRAIAAASDGSAFRAASARDGLTRIFAVRRLPGFPVDVVFGVATTDLLPAWRANLVNYLLFAVPASLALFGMTWLAARQIQRERVASWRWRTTARRLRREIDRRARTEAELRQAQKIEALGQLTGGVAHDFNNLLAVLQGCLEMLTGRQSDDRLQMRVDLARETVARGIRLTRQLLAFARRQPEAVAPLDLNAQLLGMTELLARTVGSGVAIETDLAPGLWPIDADPTRLELAVINLAVNARDAMPDGGTLRIRTANRAVPAPASDDGRTESEFVELAVCDTGDGMPPEVAERAFEPFFTTKKPDKGTGLGLSMVDELARQSGGGATIDSVVGRGTTVTLRLRRSRNAAAGATGLPPDGPP
ncbi:MAG TPA: ATP-binding protein [Stellaceae bacterium]|nr:ATP-binding protein [Stellaceae bacterium]